MLVTNAQVRMEIMSVMAITCTHLVTWTLAWSLAVGHSLWGQGSCRSACRPMCVCVCVCVNRRCYADHGMLNMHAAAQG